MTESVEITRDLDEISRIASAFAMPSLPTKPGVYRISSFPSTPLPPAEVSFGERFDLDGYRYYTHKYPNGTTRKFMRKLPDGKWIELTQL